MLLLWFFPRKSSFLQELVSTVTSGKVRLGGRLLWEELEEVFQTNLMMKN